MQAVATFSIFFLLTMWSKSASAGDWVSNGPNGGYIEEIYASPSAPSLLFAMTPGGLFRSTDSGNFWQRAENGISGTVGPFAATFSGDLFAFDPLYERTAYVIDSSGALYRTDDSGEHWLATGFKLAGSSAMTMAVDRNFPRHIYLGTNNGVLRSLDGGATFEFAMTGLANGAVTAIAVDPMDAAHVLIGGPYVPGGPTFNFSLDGGDHWSGGYSECDELFVCGYVHDLRYAGGSRWVAADGGALLASDDGGMNWGQAVDIGTYGVSATAGDSILFAGSAGVAFSPDGFDTVTFANDGLSVDGVNPLQALSAQIFNNYPDQGPWFAGTFIAGLYRSSDMGALWAPVNEGLVATDIYALAVDPNNPAHVLAGDFNGIFSGEGGRSLYVSNDGGNSWSAASLPPPARYIRAIAFDPTADGSNSVVYAVGHFAGEQFGPNRNGGLYKSVDGGIEWSVIDQGLPTAGDPPRAYVGGVRGLALDPNSCAAPPLAEPCARGPLQVLYATASGRYVDDDHSFRVLKSVDAGANWSSSDSGLPNTLYLETGDYEEVTTYRLLVNAQQSNIVYVTTWFNASAGHSSSPGIASGVFRSDDGGAHWSLRSEGLPRYPGSVDTSLDVLAMVADPSDPETLWAGMTDTFGTSPGAVYKTVDGGAHWESASEGLRLASVRTITIDSDNRTLYAGGLPEAGTRRSIFQSTDGGTHWSAMEDAPPSLTVNELVIDPEDNHVLAGTTGGVWGTTGRIFANGFD